ncbi:hypothetical protein Y1Q_0008781 [Alligator mississippiensis]|uniref:Uncharacterized protein n=1 Tax=Alligator mississippiensis TaxID=8496 RepID=A0A151NA29_ALLMI|nr:hypothetical protein Y1Q_0008781 [Alligator mississippiensis]
MVAETVSSSWKKLLLRELPGTSCVSTCNKDPKRLDSGQKSCQQPFHTRILIRIDGRSQFFCKHQGEDQCSPISCS